MNPDDSQLGPHPGSTEALWPLKRISVFGLFGGDRELRVDLEDSATILTGENGSGKSTILRAIDLAGSRRWSDLAKLPVARIEMEFTNFETVTVEVEDDQVRLVGPGGSAWSPPSEDLHELSAEGERRLSYLDYRIRNARTRVEREEAVRRRNDLVHGRRQDEAEVTTGNDLERPEWIDVLESGFRTKLVSTRRLELDPQADLRRRNRDDAERQPLMIDKVSRDLGDLVRRRLSRFVAESSKAEKALPAKIVAAMQATNPLSAAALQDEVESLEREVVELAASLTRIGLLPGDESAGLITDYRESGPQVLVVLREVYSERLSRLRQLDGLKDELELFAAFAGDRFSGKQVELSPELGIIVVLADGERIAPHQLSSGEQQLLVLGYELLFETEPQSVVLIDEPELSLHVSWLDGLMNAFLGIGSSRSLQYVIATHSPSVVAGHADLERSLDLMSAP